VSDLRVAVIGVGHLGQIHARLLAQVAGVKLVAVVDPSPEARELGAKLTVASLADYKPLLGQIDAAIIATPSRLHYGVAIDLLQNGVHVFVEKPMTLNVGDADDLVAEAQHRQLVLQVGHVERFNPALTAAATHLSEPKYIDAVRSGPFTCRSTDIGVVLDLMIHDIDIALSLVGDDVASVQALGAAVFGPNEDWAQARLTFAGGCVANLYASRVSWQPQRTMQVFGCDRMVAIDFGGRCAKVMQICQAVSEGHIDVNHLDRQQQNDVKDRLFSEYLPLVDLPIVETNPLLEEQRQFVAAIRGQQQVAVSGEAGKRALDVAERVLAEISAHRWDGNVNGAIGPRFETRSPVLRGPHWRQTASRRLAG